MAAEPRPTEESEGLTPPHGVLVVNARIRIPHEEFAFKHARSSGPGGQNVNKVNSKVTLRWRPLESVRIEEAQRRKRDVRVIKKDVWKWRFFRCVPLRFESWMEDAHKWDAIQQWNSGVGDRMPIFDHYPVWSRDPDQVAKPCHAPRQEEGQLEVWPSCSHRIVLLFQRFFCFGHGVP